MKKPASICVFGDSVSWGAWDLEKGGWVSRLWADVGIREGDDYVEIYNCSISGGTTDTILERFEREAKIRNCDALIFQAGGNDGSYEDTPDNVLVPLEKFKKNIGEIITRAKKITDRIVCTDLKNCDESKTMPVPWINLFSSNENIKTYSKAMEEICKENGVLFLDMQPLDVSYFEDGLHPNASGHQKIFEHIKEFLIHYGWI